MWMQSLLMVLLVGCQAVAAPGEGASPRPAPVRPAPVVPSDHGPTYRVLTLPKVRVEPGLVDFGDVRPGKQVSRDVTIFNESEVPIRIARTVSTCRCTVATADHETIEPGGSAALTITLDTGELTGQVTRYIQVQFEGGARPLAIGARAYVSEGIRAEIRYERPDRDDLLLVNLVEPTGQGFRVLDVSGAAPVYVDGSLAEGEARAEHHLRVTRALDDPRLWLAILTDHPDAPLVVVAVDPDAIGDSEVRPTWIFGEKRLIVRGLAPGVGQVVDVNLRGISAKEQGDIDEVRVGDDRLSVRVVGGEADGPFAVNLGVELTPRADVKGLVHTVLELSARGFVQHVDLIALVNGAAPEAAPATEASEPTATDDEVAQEAGTPAAPVDEAATPNAISGEDEYQEPAATQGDDSGESEVDDAADDGWAPITPPGRSSSRS